jgi:hypothetical protein
MSSLSNTYISSHRVRNAPAVSSVILSSSHKIKILYRIEYHIMNELVRHALEHNKDAVSLMLVGEDKKAAKALQEALAVMKRLHHASSSGTESKSSSTALAPNACDRAILSQDAGMSAASTSQTKSMDPFVVFHDNVTMPDVHDQMGSNNFIYNRAFVLDAPQPKEPQRGETELQVYSASFVFNLALMYHRRGVNQRSAYLLAKAQKVYEMGKKIVRGLSLNHGTALSISLAATNNISLIQFGQGHLSAARHGLNCVAYLIDSDENSRDLFSEREWDGLHLNMLLLNPPGSAPAA